MIAPPLGKPRVARSADSIEAYIAATVNSLPDLSAEQINRFSALMARGVNQ